MKYKNLKIILLNYFIFFALSCNHSSNSDLDNKNNQSKTLNYNIENDDHLDTDSGRFSIFSNKTKKQRIKNTQKYVNSFITEPARQANRYMNRHFIGDLTRHYKVRESDFHEALSEYENKMSKKENTAMNRTWRINKFNERYAQYLKTHKKIKFRKNDVLEITTSSYYYYFLFNMYSLDKLRRIIEVYARDENEELNNEQPIQKEEKLIVKLRLILLAYYNIKEAFKALYEIENPGLLDLFMQWGNIGLVESDYYNLRDEIRNNFIKLISAIFKKTKNPGSLLIRSNNSKVGSDSYISESMLRNLIEKDENKDLNLPILTIFIDIEKQMDDFMGRLIDPKIIFETKDYPKTFEYQTLIFINRQDGDYFPEELPDWDWVDNIYRGNDYNSIHDTPVDIQEKVSINSFKRILRSLYKIKESLDNNNDSPQDKSYEFELFLYLLSTLSNSLHSIVDKTIDENKLFIALKEINKNPQNIESLEERINKMLKVIIKKGLKFKVKNKYIQDEFYENRLNNPKSTVRTAKYFYGSSPYNDNKKHSFEDLLRDIQRGFKQLGVNVDISGT